MPNDIPAKAPTFDQRRDLSDAYERYCKHQPQAGAYITNERFRRAMEGLEYFEKQYNRLLDEAAGNFERWFRLANCPGILTGYQPECATIIDDICRMKAVLEQALKIAVPDIDQREAFFEQGKAEMQQLPAWRRDDGA